MGLIPLNRVAEPDIERRSRPEAKFAFSSGYVQAATGQAQGCVGGDSAPATNDVVEASCRNARVVCKLVHAHVQRLQDVLQDRFTGMRSGDRFRHR